jgi:chromosome segregation ATPase
MGLFKKRSDPAELDQLRSEITAMAARLDAADAEKAQLQSRVQHLATKVDEPPVPAAPPPPAIDPTELDVMRARIQQLTDRMEQLPPRPDAPPIDPATIRTLEVRVEGISAQLAEARAADGAVEPPVDPADVEALRTRIEQLQTRLDAPITAPAPPPPPPPLDPTELDALRQRIEQLDARIAAVDGRITSISTELANQLTELSGEVDAVATEQAKSADQPPVVQQDIDVDAVVDELRDTQIRLANEQARYQIAFRQELADLAERLRRR